MDIGKEIANTTNNSMITNKGKSAGKSWFKTENHK